MEQSQEELDRLIDKYLSGEAIYDELNLLERSYMNASRKISKKDIPDSMPANFHEIAAKSWANLMDKIEGERSKRLILWPRILAIAASQTLKRIIPLQVVRLQA